MVSVTRTNRPPSARGYGSLEKIGAVARVLQCTFMAKVITQRTLRNESGEIMRGLDRGESYIVTRNGVPVGELMPVRRREAVPAGMLLAALAGAPRIDPTRFRRDVDELIDQDPRPRA